MTFSRQILFATVLPSLAHIALPQAGDLDADTQVALCRSLLGKKIGPGLVPGATQAFTDGEVASAARPEASSRDRRWAQAAAKFR